MTDDDLVAVLDDAADAVRDALDRLDDWGPVATREGQYHSDLAADEAAVEVLVGAGLGVLSEETGLHHPERPVRVALDPLDGSTNASRRLPWYATSLCAVDGDGPLAAVVVNQATGDRFQAVRGGGATRNGRAVSPTACTSMGDALVALTALPPSYLGWNQYRSLGAAALDICAVAAGQLDAYLDFSNHAHAPWDYLGGLLVCREAGAHMADAEGRELVTVEPGQRRRPVVAATAPLLHEALSAHARARASS